jgi:glutamyl-tRNA synthetase
MQISHVIRAEEWISSTPKHLMLYDAFGWKPPVFMHMPLLRNPDKSKISKRKNPVSLEYYERQGYLPEAMLNFLALLGWSMPDERELFSLDEMIQNFSFDRLSLGGPVFDLQKLEWINGMYLRQLSPAELAERLQAQVVRPKAQRLGDPAYVQAMIPLLQERLHTLGEFHNLSAYFFDTPLSYDPNVLVPKDKKPRETANVLSEVGDHLLRYDGAWSDAGLEQAMRDFLDRTKWGNRSLFMALRVAITGRTASPPLFATMAVLGRDTCLARLEDAVATLQK